MERVCFCHDETAEPFTCTACGCCIGDPLAIYDVWDAVEAALLPVLKKQNKAALRYLAERSDYSSAFRELCAQAAARRGK